MAIAEQLGSLLAYNVTKLTIYLNEPPYETREATVLGNELRVIIEHIISNIESVPLSRGRTLTNSLNDLAFDLLAAVGNLLNTYLTQLSGTKPLNLATTGQVWDLAGKLKVVPLSAKAITGKQLASMLELLDDAIAEVEAGDEDPFGDDDDDEEDDKDDDGDKVTSKIDNLAVSGAYDPESRQIVVTQGTNLLKLNKLIFQKLKKICNTSSPDASSDSDNEKTIELVDEIADLCKSLSEQVDDFAATLGDKPSRQQIKDVLASYSESNLKLVQLGKQFGEPHAAWFETAENKWNEVSGKIASA